MSLQQRNTHTPQQALVSVNQRSAQRMARSGGSALVQLPARRVPPATSKGMRLWLGWACAANGWPMLVKLHGSKVRGAHGQRARRQS